MFVDGTPAEPLHLNEHISIELAPRQGMDDRALRSRSLQYERTDDRGEIIILAEVAADSGNMLIGLAQPVGVDVHRAVKQANEIVMQLHEPSAGVA